MQYTVYMQIGSTLLSQSRLTTLRSWTLWENQHSFNMDTTLIGQRWSHICKTTFNTTLILRCQPRNLFSTKIQYWNNAECPLGNLYSRPNWNTVISPFLIFSHNITALETKSCMTKVLAVTQHCKLWYFFHCSSAQRKLIPPQGAKWHNSTLKRCYTRRPQTLVRRCKNAENANWIDLTFRTSKQHIDLTKPLIKHGNNVDWFVLV